MTSAAPTRYWMSVAGLALAAIMGAGCNDSSYPVARPADGDATMVTLANAATRPSAAPATAPANQNLVQVLVPKKPDQFWWWYGSHVNLDALSLQISGDPDIDSGQCRQYRLADGRHAFGMYSPAWFCSAIVVYTATDEKLHSKAGATVSTQAGTLTAWGLRHEPTDSKNPDEEVWTTLLTKGPDSVPKTVEVYPLRGQITVCYNADGLVNDLTLKLKTDKRLPKFMKYVKFREQKLLESIEFDKRMQEEHGEKPTVSTFNQEQLAIVRALPEWDKDLKDLPPEILDKMVGPSGEPIFGPARVEGSIAGHWHNNKSWLPNMLPLLPSGGH